MRPALVLLAVMATAVPVHAEPLWLVIGASDATPAGIAHKAKGLANGEGLIIQTSDCGDSKNVFAWAAKIEAREAAAEKELNEIKNLPDDAYVKKCEVKPGSLLAYRVPAVDASIAEVPANAVNWSDEDRVSSVKPLPDGRAIIIARYYEPDKEDPLEGRRVRVSLADRSGKIRQLEKNCIQAAGFKSRGGNVAFQCAREEAGNYLLHSVLVFDNEGRKRKELSHCRNPYFSGSYLWCQAESVKADGTLQLRAVRHPLQK